MMRVSAPRDARVLLRHAKNHMEAMEIIRKYSAVNTVVEETSE